MRVIEKKVDIEKIIKDLGDTDFSGSNKEQGKMVALMNGLAFSDDAKANEFMKKLNTATSEISKEVLA